jgi:predicted phage tail protein
MPIPFLAVFAIGLGLMVIGFMLMPKPKQPKPTTVDDLQTPTAEAGRPVPVIMGSMEISGLNVLWWGDKSISNHKMASGGKK